MYNDGEKDHRFFPIIALKFRWHFSSWAAKFFRLITVSVANFERR